MGEIDREEILRVFPQVAGQIADALALEPGECRLDARLIDDLAAESIDFLDIVYRLEQVFQLQIPRGQIIEDARGELSEEEFEVDGRLTEPGLQRLRTYMSEVPAESFRPGMRVGEIPYLFTVETFCKVVVRARRAAA